MGMVYAFTCDVCETKSITSRDMPKGWVHLRGSFSEKYVCAQKCFKEAMSAIADELQPAFMAATGNATEAHIHLTIQPQPFVPDDR